MSLSSSESGSEREALLAETAKINVRANTPLSDATSVEMNHLMYLSLFAKTKASRDTIFIHFTRNWHFEQLARVVTRIFKAFLSLKLVVWNPRGSIYSQEENSKKILVHFLFGFSFASTDIEFLNDPGLCNYLLDLCKSNTQCT